MDAFQSMVKILKKLEILAKIIGFDVFNESYRPTFLTVFIVSYVGLILGIVIQNIFKFSNDIEELSFTLVSLPFVTQGLYRMYMFLKDHKKIRENRKEIMKIYLNLMESSKDNQIFVKYFKFYVKCVKILVIFFLCFVTFYTLLPGVTYLVTGQHVLIFNAYIPLYQDIQQFRDFIINYIWHVISGGIFICGIVPCHAFHLTPIISICLQIDHLNERLEELASSSKDFSKLKDIIEWHSQLLR